MSELKFYQPEYDEKIWKNMGFHDHMVFLNEQTAQDAFPRLDIHEYAPGDIEDPWVVDLVEELCGAAQDAVFCAPDQEADDEPGWATIRWEDWERLVALCDLKDAMALQISLFTPEWI